VLVQGKRAKSTNKSYQLIHNDISASFRIKCRQNVCTKRLLISMTMALMAFTRAIFNVY